MCLTKNTKNFNIVKIFQIFLLYTLLNFSISNLTFKYPYAIKLSDGNILVIHQNGTAICNGNLTEFIDPEYGQIEFAETQGIETEEDYSKIESVTVDRHIICIIHDRIYVFDNHGYLLRFDND